MSTFAVLLLCIQACLVQNVFGQYLGGRGCGCGGSALGVAPAAGIGSVYGGALGLGTYGGPFGSAYGGAFGSAYDGVLAPATAYGGTIAPGAAYGGALGSAYGGAFGSAYDGVLAPSAVYGGAYGGAGEGNVAVIGQLPVAGNTAVAGAVPISGAVTFGGALPAAGAVSITGQCACGCGSSIYY